MNTWLTERWSVNGRIIVLVAKQNSKPKNIDIGSAGNALRQIAKSSRVKHKPWNKETILNINCLVECFNLNSIKAKTVQKRVKTHYQNGNEAGKCGIPITIAGCFANENWVEDEIA